MIETSLPVEPASRANLVEQPPFGRVDLALLGVVTIWGTNFVIVKAAVVQFLPLVFTSLRFVIAAVALVMIVALAGLRLRLSRADVGRLALLGLVGNVGYQPLFVMGLVYTTASNSALILASMPVLVALLSHILRLERLGLRAWAGVACSFIGLALVIVGGSRGLSLASETLLGDALTLGAALCWATYTVMTRPLAARLPPLLVTVTALLFSLPFLLFLAAPSLVAQNWSAVTLGGWAGLLCSGLLAVSLSYVIWVKGVQQLGGARTSVYANLIPLVAVITGAVFLSESIRPLQILGAACVLGGSVLARLKG